MFHSVTYRNETSIELLDPNTRNVLLPKIVGKNTIRVFVPTFFGNNTVIHILTRGVQIHTRIRVSYSYTTSKDVCKHLTTTLTAKECNPALYAYRAGLAFSSVGSAVHTRADSRAAVPLKPRWHTQLYWGTPLTNWLLHAPPFKQGER